MTALLAVALCAGPACATDQDVYSEINVLGQVSIMVASTQGGPGCAKFWWVKRLIGSVEQIGQRCGSFTLDVPSFLGISLASKLRASASHGIVIRVTGSHERVAKSITF